MLDLSPQQRLHLAAHNLAGRLGLGDLRPLRITPEGEAFATVVYDSATETLYLAPLRSAQQDARVPHLWLMLPDGGVQLVGAIDGRQPSRQPVAPGR